MACEHLFCTSDSCYAKKVLKHDSKNGGTAVPNGSRIKDGSGPYWKEDQWQNRSTEIQNMAKDSKCVDLNAVQRERKKETTRKKSQGELT